MEYKSSTMEALVNKSFWVGKNVLITGHTGFKGSWLTLWLTSLGANVFGYSLSPESDMSLFNNLKFNENLISTFNDIRNSECLDNFVQQSKPDIIFHMAAQPLVSESYINPVYTYQTNVFGTINLLEAVKKINKNCTIIVVTTDKVYENQEIEYAYKETDKLGGLDPYSSSKASCELIVNSWRNSFFKKINNIKIATARAGNVIGGGDWSKNRIIPDLIRSLQDKKTLILRNPHSTRPWQHVLEPLSGYLILAEKIHLCEDIIYQNSFNFGPNEKSNKSVVELIEECFIHWKGHYLINENGNKFYESNLLQVSIEKSKVLLNWEPKWNFQECIKNTIEWYQSFYNSENITNVTLEQIKMFNQI